tara:strand:+ start:854 stop:1330 length:477 start_codon:yes stop_codon:yes gene_type:complete
MTTLITGGDGNLANSLKKYVGGDYYNKDRLDLTDKECVENLPQYDILIHTARGKNINKNLELLYSKAKKIYVFTSKQGTFLNWKEPSNIEYGLEKLSLNFITYRHNLVNHNAQIFEPGHMQTEEQYDSIAKTFSELYMDWKFEKNMIYDLQQHRYIGY